MSVMKRMISLLLALVLLVSLVPVGVVTVSAASNFKVSQKCLDIIKTMEGFASKPYWDGGHYTVGYGTEPLSEADRKRYSKEGISKREAEELLRYYMNEKGESVNKFIDKYDLKLTQAQFDALLSFTYNLGQKWLSTESDLRTLIINGESGNAFLQEFVQYCTASGKILTGLIRRRLIEANMYIYGVYSTTVPANLCYVKYDANGGTTDMKVQGYDSTDPVAPAAVPERSGYDFTGWYTQPTGGTKITSLTAACKSDTVYAHWKLAGSEEPTEPEDTTVEGTKVLVTANEVNVRKGPGTGYSVVTRVDAGKELTITETANGSGYLWGKYSNGWIALKYTNYDNVIGGTTDEPAGKAINGTITAGELRIREGAGTGYAITGYYHKGDRVEIFAQKTVGTTVWGQTLRGWISLDYVKLDETKEEPTAPTEPEETKPTVPPQSMPTDPAVPNETVPVPTQPEETVPAPTEPEEEKLTGTINVNDRLRIRKSPSTSAEIAGYYYADQQVTILERKTVGSTVWAKTDKGWISMDYVQLKADSGSAEKTVTGIIDVENTLRVRKNAGTGYAIVGYLNGGDEVTILETKKVNGVTWGRISKGWISMDYVIVDGDEGDSEDKTSTITANTLYVRSGAGTTNKIVDVLHKGDKVIVTETTTVKGVLWGKIEGGWVCMTWVK